MEAALRQSYFGWNRWLMTIILWDNHTSTDLEAKMRSVNKPSPNSYSISQPSTACNVLLIVSWYRESDAKCRSTYPREAHVCTVTPLGTKRNTACWTVVSEALFMFDTAVPVQSCQLWLFNCTGILWTWLTVRYWLNDPVESSQIFPSKNWWIFSICPPVIIHGLLENGP